MTALVKPLSVSIAVCDPALLRHSQSAVQAFQPSVVAASCLSQTGAELAASGAAAQPGVLIADLQALGEGFGDTIRMLRAQAIPPDIIVLHHSPDGGAILKAMRAGAREFFFEDIEQSLREAVAAIASESNSAQASGRLHAFIAAKGGCGLTTLASHAAASLARDADRQVLLADLHWGCPSAAFLLRANPQYTLQAAALTMDRMDDALWQAMVSRTSYGFDLAPPPAADGTEDGVKASSLGDLLRFCKTQYGNIVADCGHGVNHLTSTVMEAADEIILVTSTDVIALHHTKRLLHILQEIHGAARVRLVLNRVRKRPDMGQSELEKMLGCPVFACVPNDYRSLTQACEDGALLTPDHPFAQSVSALAMQLTGAAPALKKKRFGLFGS